MSTSRLLARLRFAFLSLGVASHRGLRLAALSLFAAVTALAAPTAPVITTASPVSAGKTGITATTPSQASVTFNWTFSPSNGGTVTTGQGTSSITYTAGPVGTYTLTCVATDTSSNTATGSKSISVITAPVAPTISTFQSDGITPESSVTASTTGHKATIAAQTGMTYLWSITDGTLSAGTTTTTATYTAGSAGTLDLTCTVKNAANDTAATTIPVPVIAAPVAAITVSLGGFSNLSTVTNGNTGYTAAVASQANSTFLWTPTNAVIDSGAGTNAITFHPTAASGSVILTCKVTNALGANVTGSKTLTIVPNPSTAVITTTGDITEGGTSHSISVTAISSATFAWQPTSGVTYSSTSLSSTGYTTTVLNGTGNVSAAVLALSCTVTNQDGTVGTATKNVNVWALPATPVVVTTKNDGTTAETQVTASTTGHKAHISPQPNVTYSWTLVDGSITAGNTTQEITFTAGSTVGTAAFKATSNVTNKAGSIVSGFSTEDVIAAPVSVISVSKGAFLNLTTVTNGITGYTAAVTSQAGSHYVWTITTPSTGAIDVGGDVNSITFHPTAASGSITITCQVTNSLGTSITGTKTLTIVPNPSTAVITTGADITEGVASHTISVTAFSGSTFAWQPTSGVTYASGTASSTTYTTTATNGTANASAFVLALSCVVTNQDGTAGTVNKNVNVWAVPATPTVVFTKNDGTTPESVNGVTAATTGHKAHVTAQPNSTYSWTLVDGTITAGGTTNEITFSAGSTIGANAVKATCTVSNKALATASSFSNESVVPAPVTTITAEKGTNLNLPYVTFGNTGITARVPVQAGSTYLWSITGGTATTGLTGDNITFNVTAAVNAFVVLNCTVTNSTGTSVTGTKSLLVIAVPTATITAASNINFDSTGLVNNAISVNAGTAFTYAWTLSTNDGAHTITPTSSTASSLNYQTTSVAGSALTLQVVRTTADGVSSAPATKTVNVWAIPTAPTVVFTQNDGTTPENVNGITAGTTGHKAHITPQAGCTYSWSVVDGVITAGGTTAEVTFTAGSTTGANAVKATCTVTNPVGTVASGFSNESVVAAPVTTITAAKGANLNLPYVTFNNTAIIASVPSQAGSTYSWTISGGTNTTPLTGSNTLTFNVTAAVNAFVVLNCTVTNSAGTAVTGTKSLLVIAVPTATITAASNINFDSTGLVNNAISVNVGTSFTYAWTLSTNDGAHTITPTSSTASSLNYQTTSVAGSALTLQVVRTTADGVSSAPATKTVNVWAIPTSPTVVFTKNDGVTPENVNGITASTTGHKAHITPQTGCTYSWTVTGGSITAGGTTSEVTFTAGTTTGAAAVKATCVVTNPVGTTASGFSTEGVVAAPVTTITEAKGANTNLPYVTFNNTAIIASVPSQAGATYSWTISGGTNTTPLTGSNTLTFNVTAAVNAFVVLNCTVTNSAGTAATGTKSVLVIAVPTATITAASNINYDSTGLVNNAISVNTGSSFTYAWTLSTNDGSHPITPTSSTASNLNYQTASVAGSAITLQVVRTTADGVSSAPATKTVNVWAIPTSPTVVFTQNDGVTPENVNGITASSAGHKAHITAQAGCTYAWTVTGGSITAGATGTEVTFTAGSTTGAAAVKATCVVTNPAGTSASGFSTEGVVAAPVTTITAAKGANTNLPYVTFNNTAIIASVPSQAGATYSWTISGGTNTTPLTGSNTLTFNVTAAVNAFVVLNCTVTNSVGTAATGTKSLLVIAVPTAVITAASDITYDSTGLVNQSISVNIGSSFTYAWTLSTNDGSHPITPTSSTASSLTYKTASVPGSTITLQVVRTTADGVSSAPATKTVTVDSVPTALAITGPSTITAGQTGYTASVDPTGTTGLTFNWLNSTGVTIVSGATTNAITFTAGGNGAGSLICLISNKAGATAVQSTKSLTVNPDSTITSTTPVTVGSINAATVPAQSNVTYTWSIIGGTGASVTSGAGTNSITYNAGTGVGNPGLTLQCVVASTVNATTSTGTKGIQTLAAPSITSFTNNGPITVGGSANLTAVFSNGTGSVNQSVGAVTSGSPVGVSPTVSTTYTLTVTNAAGTTATTSTTVTVNAGFYAATNSMTNNRQNHSSIELENGNVLISGGLNGGASTSTTDLFTTSLTNGTFAATGSMVNARSSHAAVRLGNGKVLVAGGVNGSGTTFVNAELYDPALGTYAATGNMTVARRSFTATLLPSGLALVAGGQDNSNAYLSSMSTYSTGTSTFTALGAALTTPRAGHTATLMANGKVLIFGGLTTGGTPTGTYQVFDPATSTLSTEASTSARANHTATLLPDGTVLIYGGIDGSGSVTAALLFDPVAGTFSTVTGPFAARKNHTATLLPSGKILMAGGNNGSADVATSELYDYLTSTTAATGSLTATRSFAAATLLSNSNAKYSKVLVSGGLKTSAATNTAELYDMAVSSPNQTIVLLVASSTTITAGSSVSILPVFLGGTGSVSQGVGAVISGKPFTVTPPGIAGQSVLYTLTVGAVTKSVTITLN